MNGHSPVDPPAFLSRGTLSRPMLFPTAYMWFVFVSALDAMLTWLILALGGHEVNPIADRILQRAGFPGMVIFKFAMVVLVILICEFIGRYQHGTARRLAWLAVGLTALAPLVAIIQLVGAFAGAGE